MNRKIPYFILILLFISFLNESNADERTTVNLDKDGISWQDADKYYGQYKTVNGIIVKAHNSGRAVFLNFHPNWKKYFSAVIFERHFHLFPPNPEKYYIGKHVGVRGIIKEYQGKPEIILTSPSQIQVIEK